MTPQVTLYSRSTALNGLTTTREHAVKSDRLNSAELSKLASEIGWYEEQARTTIMLVLQYRLEIGRRLICAKALLPHGKFSAWASQEFGWTPRHVQRHIELAQNAPRVSQLPPGTSLRMALAVIKGIGSSAQGGRSATQQSDDHRFIHIVGELDAQTVDPSLLMEGVTRLAEQLGAHNIRWKIRTRQQLQPLAKTDAGRPSHTPISAPSERKRLGFSKAESRR